MITLLTFAKSVWNIYIINHFRSTKHTLTVYLQFRPYVYILAAHPYLSKDTSFPSSLLLSHRSPDVG